MEIYGSGNHHGTDIANSIKDYVYSWMEVLKKIWKISRLNPSNV